MLNVVNLKQGHQLKEEEIKFKHCDREQLDFLPTAGNQGVMQPNEITVWVSTAQYRL